MYSDIIPYPNRLSISWVWLGVVVLVVLLLIVLLYSSTRVGTKAPKGAEGSARNALGFQSRRQSINPDNRLIAAIRDSTPLTLYDNVTVNIRSEFPAAAAGSSPTTDFAIMPLAISSRSCTQFAVVTNGTPSASQPIAGQSGGLGNTLEQVAWNNLSSTYLADPTNAATPPYYESFPLQGDDYPTVTFTCKGGADNERLGYSSNYSSGVTYAIALPSSFATSFNIFPSMTIPADSFLLRLYYAPTKSPAPYITSSTIAISGLLNGASIVGPTWNIPGSNPYNTSSLVGQYGEVSTYLSNVSSSDNDQPCTSLADLTNPQLILNITFSDTTTFTQNIDIVQQVYLVPPIGTLIFDPSTTYFTSNGNPQNCIWLNDAINFYDLTPPAMTRPGRTLHVLPRIMPENAELFGSRTAFTAWKAKWAKSYGMGAEDDARYTIYNSNIHKAARLNVEQPNARFGATKFADLTVEELSKYYSGVDLTSANPGLGSSPIPASFKPRNKGPTPPEYDWREQGAVTPVDDQGSCGTCTYHSTVGVVEGQWYLKTGNLVPLSVQQIVDCTAYLGNSGCSSGGMTSNLNYVISLAQQGGGLMAAADYPYTCGDCVNGNAGNNTGICLYDPSKAVGSIGSWTLLTNPDGTGPLSDDDMAKYLYLIGPLSIGIDISRIGLYEGGVTNANGTCDPTQRGHAVLLVGYGTYCGVPYWAVKNSWGTDFGVNGYIYLERYPGNTGYTTCGINATVIAGFYEDQNPNEADQLFSGTVKLTNVGVLPLVDSTLAGCSSMTNAQVNGTTSTLTIAANNTLEAQDWSNMSPSGPNSLWISPMFSPCITWTNVTFNSCNASCGSSLTPMKLQFSSNSIPQFYAIATAMQGASSTTCTEFSIPMPFTLTVAPNTFLARVVVIPDGDQQTVTLESASVCLVQNVFGGFVPIGCGQAVSSSLQNFTASNYVSVSAVNVASASQLSINVQCQFSNGTSLSATKQIVQKFFYVPPIATILLTPNFTAKTISFVVLNDALNIYGGSIGGI